VLLSIQYKNKTRCLAFKRCDIHSGFCFNSEDDVLKLLLIEKRDHFISKMDRLAPCRGYTLHIRRFPRCAYGRRLQPGVIGLPVKRHPMGTRRPCHVIN
jgi:hypothetical protein